MARSRSEQAGILVFGKVLATLSDFIVPLAIVRLLGKVEVGLLSALLLIYSTLALVLTAGLPETISYFLPTRTLDERRAVAANVAKALLMLGAGAGAVMLGAAALGQLYPSVEHALVGEGEESVTGGSLMYLLVLAFLPIGDLPARMLPNLLVVEERPQAAAAIGVVKSIGGALAAIVPLALTDEMWVVVSSVTGFGLAYGALVPWFIRRIYVGAAKVPSPVSVGTLVRFAIPIGLTDIVSLLNSQLDRYLIVFFFPAAVFAEYQAGAWQVPMIATIPYAVGIVYAPRMVELFKDGLPREAIGIWRQSISKVSLIVIPATMVFVVAAEETMELLFTADYVNAASVFRLYSLLTLGRVAAYGTVIVAAGRPRYVFTAAILSFASNLVISVPLVLLIGFEGPAAGTLIAFVPTIAYYCWCIARSAGLPFRDIFPFVGWLKVVAVACVASVPAFAFKLTTDLPAGPSLLGEAVILLATFGAVGTLTGLIGREDWSYMRSWVALKILR